MERSAAWGALRAGAGRRGRARDELAEGGTGGGSDGNFTAALGVPTLDGLGAIGDGAHALHEHVELASLPAAPRSSRGCCIGDPRRRVTSGSPYCAFSRPTMCCTRSA